MRRFPQTKDPPLKTPEIVAPRFETVVSGSQAPSIARMCHSPTGDGLPEIRHVMEGVIDPLTHSANGIAVT